jgi:Protein of unknown function (DUF4240)
MRTGTPKIFLHSHKNPIPLLNMADTVLHIPLPALDEQLIQELKDQFGPAELEIRIQKRTADWLTEDEFWRIIDRLDWDKTGDDDAVLAPAVAALAASPIAAIHQFEDILAEKLWHLDTQKHAEASLGGDPGAILSADGFLYDRCCVVANGKDYYYRVLKNPDQMPVGLSFGRLLSLADQAYILKTGKALIHIPKFNYETCSNVGAWS